jgi:HK97 family phage prohead protease
MKLATALGVSFAVKSVDTKARRFAGLASTWDQDLGNDVIHKGAFAKTLSHWRSAKNKPIYLLDSHRHMSVDDVLGKMVEATETDAGLEAEFELRDTRNAQDALKAVEGGFIDGLSIGYQPTGEPRYEKTVSGKTVRHLTEIKLHEVSLVVFPMNEGARVDPSSIKSILDAVKANQLTLSDEDKTELLAYLSTATTPIPAPDAPKGLTPNDPLRIAMNERFRGLKLRSLQL